MRPFNLCLHQLTSVIQLPRPHGFFNRSNGASRRQSEARLLFSELAVGPALVHRRTLLTNGLEGREGESFTRDLVFALLPCAPDDHAVGLGRRIMPERLSVMTCQPIEFNFNADTSISTSRVQVLVTQGDGLLAVEEPIKRTQHCGLTGARGPQEGRDVFHLYIYLAQAAEVLDADALDLHASHCSEGRQRKGIPRVRRAD